jgi:hypothetical protein
MMQRLKAAEALEKKRKKKQRKRKKKYSPKVYFTIFISTVSPWTLFLFLYTFPSAQPHHIIFEEIGEMAGALSYIHTIIPVSISGLYDAI